MRSEAADELGAVLESIRSQAGSCVTECEDRHARIAMLKIERDYAQNDIDQAIAYLPLESPCQS